MKKFYVNPDILILNVINEGVMCTSEEEEDAALILPGSTWKDETIW